MLVLGIIHVCQSLCISINKKAIMTDWESTADAGVMSFQRVGKWWVGPAFKKNTLASGLAG